MRTNRWTKPLALFIAAINLTFGPVLTCYADETEATDGTIHISDAGGLLDFAKAAKTGDSVQKATVYLDADIDMSTYNEFEGIDTFSGVFEGGGHTISGINLTEGSGALGFFGYIEEGAVVQNLTVDGTIYSTDNNNYIGIISGTNAGTINNCRSLGIVTGTGTAAGITGYNGGNGVISGCTNEAKIYSLKQLGGITGENRGSIVDCHNTGDIDADSSWLELEDDSVTSFSIESIVKNIQDTIEVGVDIGGVAGVSSGEILNCDNKGTVGYQHAGKNVGGIVGRFTGSIDSCTNNGKVYGKQDVGGIAGQFEPTILETGSDIKNYINDLEGLSNQLVADTKAASDSAGGSLKDVGDSVKEGGEQIDSDVNSVAKDITSNITDTANSTKRSINDATASINNLKNNIANANPEEIKENAVEDIEKIDYDSVISQITDISTNIDNAQTAIGNYDASKVGNRITEQIDSTATSEYNEVNDAAKKVTDRVDDATGDTAEQLYEMSDNMAKSTATISNDINAINAKVADIMSLAEEQAENFGKIADGEDIIEDYSAVDSESEEAARLKNSINNGYVNGDRNVGGVVGALAIEGTDSADSKVGTSGNKYVTLAVLENSNSTGLIELRKENAGGIVGNASLGLIRNCDANIRIISEEGNYVGGVAGYSKGTVENCYSASVLDGSNYIGGVAGAAKKMRNCYSMSEISSDVNWGGEVIGDVINDTSGDITTAHSKMMDSIFNNYFVGSKYGGIDNVSYSGIAEAMSYEALMASEAAAHFDNISVAFYNKDFDLISNQSVEYGTDVSELQYPDIESDANTYIAWDGIYSDTISSNMFLVAEDADNVTVLASDLLIDNKPVALVQGTYYEISKLEVKENTTTALPNKTNEDSIINCYDIALTNVSEQEDVSQIRFYVGDAKNVKLYEQQDGKWVSQKIKRTGSYVQCDFTKATTTFAVETYTGTSYRMYIAVAAAALAVVIILIAVKRKKH